MDNLGQPEGAKAPEQRTASDAQQTSDQETRIASDAPEQTVSLNTTLAAQQLGVDSRTVRRYIVEGIRTTGGAILRLEARQVRTNHGPEWQIYQTNLDTFKQQRDRAATEGQAAGQLMREGETSQALTTSVQLLATELERRSLALTEAQQTIAQIYAILDRLPERVTDDVDSLYGWPEHRLRHGESFVYSYLGDGT